MKSAKFLLTAAALVSLAAVYAVPASGHGSSTVTIQHQMRGCHAWSYGNGPFKASLRVTAHAGEFVRFVNNDVMPHRLIQLSGPKIKITHALMNHMGASAQVLLGKGVYRFGTKAGEDYPSMGGMHTVGEDYVLRVTLVVK